ncbi:MAG: helix-turn-helix domain-containing protein [Candidatus Paceibacterota bacterium]|jgi:cytoskeletal protein RodZ
MEESFNEQKSVGLLILDAMRNKSMSIEKLSQLTGISDRFLDLLTEEHYSRLPSAPYVRGYLFHIADVLNLNGEEIWKEYVQQNAIASAKVTAPHPGKRDFSSEKKLSMNQLLTARNLSFAALVLVVLTIVIVRAAAFTGTPTLSLENFSDTLVTTTSTFTVRGSFNPQNKLTLNEEVISVDEKGTFEKELTLTPGFNTFHFKIKGLLGKELEVTKQIYYTTSTKHVEPSKATTTNE